jgi:hypothetical protein
MATQAEAKSLSEFEKEAEHTRADLMHTVDELHNRVSPRALKEEMKAYVRETRQDFIRNLERRARENPLQTVAVAAGLAYPAWRLLMNIPAPVLLVGAGLALAGKGASMPSTRPYGMADGGGSLGETLKRSVQDASSTVSDTVAGMKEKAVAAASDATSTIMAGMDKAADRASSTISAAMNSVSDAMNSARNIASDALSEAQQTLSSAGQGGVDAITRTGGQLTETFRRSSGTLAEMIESQPFVWGAVGLLAGAAIASALPVTQAENQLFAQTSDQLKNRASDLASRGLEVATETAQDVYQETVARVKEQGVSADVVRNTIKDVGEKVSSVVERAGDALKNDEAATAPHSTSNM